ncbi:hypothetical protein HYDPIDRAFT_26377 [Hydnomerulius pinastri MD-312]|nr:hypothetical protein HYDPIDRAFT_26377 [Hydnomerulius pinastri MD-312]
MVHLVGPFIALLFATSALADSIASSIYQLTQDVQTLNRTISQFVSDPCTNNFSPILDQGNAVAQALAGTAAITTQPISEVDGADIQSALQAAMPVFSTTLSYIQNQEAVFASANSGYVGMVRENLNLLNVRTLLLGLKLVTNMPCDLRAGVAEAAGEVEAAYQAAIDAYTKST